MKNKNIRVQEVGFKHLNNKNKFKYIIKNININNLEKLNILINKKNTKHFIKENVSYFNLSFKNKTKNIYTIYYNSTNESKSIEVNKKLPAYLEEEYFKNYNDFKNTIKSTSRYIIVLKSIKIKHISKLKVKDFIKFGFNYKKETIAQLRLWLISEYKLDLNSTYISIIKTKFIKNKYLKEIKI